MNPNVVLDKSLVEVLRRSLSKMLEAHLNLKANPLQRGELDTEKVDAYQQNLKTLRKETEKVAVLLEMDMNVQILIYSGFFFRLEDTLDGPKVEIFSGPPINLDTWQPDSRGNQ